MSILNACIPPRFRNEVIDSTTNYNWFIGLATNILQLGNLNPEMPGLSKGGDGSTESSYIGYLRQWNQARQRWMKRADERSSEILGLGSERWGRMFKAFYAEQVGEHPDGTKIDGPISEEELRRIYKLDDESIAVRDKISTDFRAFLSEVERALILDAQQRFREVDQIGLRDTRIAEIRADFAKLRAKPYFPLMRFGRYTLTTFDQEGQLVEHQQFEKEREAESELKKAKARNPRTYSFKMGILPDVVHGLQGMPPTLQSRLIEELELTNEQKTQLTALMHKMAPGQSFRKQLLKRKGVKGFAEDGLRTYANYFFHGANHLARSLYSERMKETIDLVERRRPFADNVIDMRKVQGIKQYMQKHFEYIMNPKNELAGLRAFGFLWYLGFMPKSAFINLSQVPLVSFPFLAARHGDINSSTAIAKAMKDARTALTRDRGFSADEVRAYERLMNDGLIDQSFASELAAVSHGTGLTRALVTNPHLRPAQSVIGQGAWMFSIAEGYNRRVTGTAAYRLRRDELLKGRKLAELTEEEQSVVENQAYLAAREAIERTQFEYSSWNRPVFMRGKKSVIFLFMQYLQNMLFFLSRGGEGRGRFLAMMLVAAGLQGMPFMEDLLDIIDTLFSTGNKKFESRKELRDVLSNFVEDPDIILLGGGNYGFGLSALGNMVGLPIPEFDVQGSLSLGRIVPGVGALTSTLQGEQTNPERALMEFSEDALGAMAAIPINFLRAGMSDSPYLWKRLELAMPSFARSITKAGRFALEGEEISSTGATLVTFSKDNPKHVAEILLQSAGFAPRRITKMQKVRAQMKEVEIFYSLRRRGLMQDLDYALNTGDQAVIKETLDEITRYNRDVPYSELGIARKDVIRSRRARQRSRQRTTAGLPMQERYVRVTQDVARSFGGVFPPEQE